MTRITNSLFESIRQVTNPVLDEVKVDAAHFCATHVEHSLYGEGECISEQHAKPNADGTIDWYNVKFADGQVRKIQTEAVKVKKAKMHEHATPEGDTIEEKQLHPNQQVLDVHEPEKDKLTAKDFEMLRKGKKKVVKEEEQIVELKKSTLASYAKKATTSAKHLAWSASAEAQHGNPRKAAGLANMAAHRATGVGKAIDRMVKEEEQIDEMGHAGKVTMKQIAKSSASPTVKKAIGKAAPDIKSYGDRAAALTAAGIKRESVEQVTELSTGTLLKVKHAAVRDANDATRDSDDARADKRYNLAGKASNKIELRNRAAGLKPSGQHSMDEGISETIVKHNDFTIEITDNPTFGDFLRAVQSIVRTDEESMQKEIVAIAEQAFAENYEEIIIEAFTRMEIEDKMSAHRKAGNTVSADKYGTKNGQPYAEYVVTDQEGGRKKYIHHGTARRMESMSSVTKKDKE